MSVRHWLVLVVLVAAGCVAVAGLWSAFVLVWLACAAVGVLLGVYGDDIGERYD